MLASKLQAQVRVAPPPVSGRPPGAPRGSTARTVCIGTASARARFPEDEARAPSLSHSRAGRSAAPAGLAAALVESSSKALTAPFHGGCRTNRSGSRSVQSVAGQHWSCRGECANRWDGAGEIDPTRRPHPTVARTTVSRAFTRQPPCDPAAPPALAGSAGTTGACRSSERLAATAPSRPTQQRAARGPGAAGLLLCQKQESRPVLLLVVRSGCAAGVGADDRIQAKARVGSPRA